MLEPPFSYGYIVISSKVNISCFVPLAPIKQPFQ